MKVRLMKEAASQYLSLRFAYMPPEELGENHARYSVEFIDRLAVLLDSLIGKLMVVYNTSVTKEVN